MAGILKKLHVSLERTLLRSSAHYEQLPFGPWEKSTSNVICLRVCPHLLLICPPAEKPKTTFYGLWSNSKFTSPWDDHTAGLPSPRRFAFHFQLVQSSLTLKIVTFHLCNENFTTSDHLGEVFVGEALNLVEHLTHSQGHLPCFLV